MTDDEAIAVQAIIGDRDEPRTLFAWLIVLNGREVSLQELMQQVADETGGREEEAHWVAAARICDGIDVAEVTKKVEEAFNALGVVEQAFKYALPKPEEVR